MRVTPSQELSTFFKHYRPKAVCLDVDGTIMNSQHEVSSATKTAIHSLQQAGIACGLATGRAAAGSFPLMDSLKLEGTSMIFAGALLCDSQSKKILYDQPLDQEAVDALINLSQSNTWCLELYSTDKIFTKEKNELSDIHIEYQYQEPKYDIDWQHVKGQRLLKAVIIVRGERDYQRVMDLESSLTNVAFTPAPGAAHPGIMFVNVTHRLASRTNAFEQLLKIHNLEPKDVMCFGDALGDKVFIERSGCGVAMENAPVEVKKKARFIAAHVDSDGVATIINALLDSIS